MVRVFLNMFMKPFFNPIFSHVRAPILYSNVHPQRFFATYKDLHKETFTFASKCYYFNLREDADNKDVFIVITELDNENNKKTHWFFINPENAKTMVRLLKEAEEVMASDKRIDQADKNGYIYNSRFQGLKAPRNGDEFATYIVKVRPPKEKISDDMMYNFVSVNIAYRYKRISTEFYLAEVGAIRFRKQLQEVISKYEELTKDETPKEESKQTKISST